MAAWHYLDEDGIPRRRRRDDALVPPLPAPVLAAVSSGAHLAVITIPRSTAASNGHRLAAGVLTRLRRAGVLLLKAGGEAAFG